MKKKMKAADLIEELEAMTRRHLKEVELLLGYNNDELNWRQEESSWSILECAEHLNRYGDFYIPEIDRRIKQGSRKNPQEFNTGWLGNYFAKSMLPKEKLNKMKTFKNMNPLGSDLDRSVLEKFRGQLKEMLHLLKQAGTIDLTRTKTGITISNWIKLRLGDTLRVVIYHNERHIAQINRISNQIERHPAEVTH